MVEVKTEGDSNTISGFVGQLKEMLEKLVEAQKKHREVHAKMMKQCLNEDKFREKEIKVAKDAFNRASNARTKCKASLKNARKSLPVLRKTRNTYIKELRRATEARNAERRKYENRRDSLKEALKFLSEFISYVTRKFSKGYKAFALAEMSQVLLKHAAKLSLMTSAVPVLVAIATERKASNYTYVANQGLGTRLKQALITLVRKLQSDKIKNANEEKAAKKIYNHYKNKLTKVIGTLLKNINRVANQILRMTRCIDNENKILKTASKKRNRNSMLRKNSVKMCRSFNKEFIHATFSRLDEIKTMHSIIDIVKKRFSKLPKGIIGYLESIKDKFVTYVNGTKFQKYIVYQRKMRAINRKGRLLANFKGTAKNPKAAIHDKEHGEGS